MGRFSRAKFMHLARRACALLLSGIVAAGCATPDRSKYVVPQVISPQIFSTTRSPVVRVSAAQGGAGEAILSAAAPPDEEAVSPLEVAAAIPIAVLYSCMFALCLGAPVVLGLDYAFLKAKLGPIAKTLAAHSEGADGPWQQQLADSIRRRWSDNAELDPEIVLTLTTVAVLNALSEKRVCVEAAARITLERNRQPIYENYLRIGDKEPGPYGARVHCDTAEALAADNALAVRNALTRYAEAVPAMLQQRLPGLPWRSP